MFNPWFMFCCRVAALAILVAAPAYAVETLTVRKQAVADSKAVFATVESINEVPARARIGGTVTWLPIDEGSRVTSGQIVATVVDEKLALQLTALDAQIKALEAQLALLRTELERSESLFKSGTIAKARLDQAQTAVERASGDLRARIADRAVIAQQLAEGEVRAPVAGRVIDVPVTVGTVVLPGEAIARIATENFILRLKLPERHARYVREGDAVSLGSGDFASATAMQGRIVTVYPRIDNGRVVADAEVEGLGDFFVGERIRVNVATTERSVLAVPEFYIANRFGVDYVLVMGSGGNPIEVAVQRGRPLPGGDATAAIEILSGLRDGDVLVRP